MSFDLLAVDELVINSANDRHGELRSENLAIAELFRLHDTQMRNLAADIASVGTVYDPPLVLPVDGKFVVFDGNRRVTCIKLLRNPEQAPSMELRTFFGGLAKNSNLPESLTCQVEQDRNVIDSILFRRHTGSQRGVGQLDWNNRAKLNFVERTGQGGGVNVAAEVESLLAQAGKLPSGNIPWSTMSRLLSSEEFRNRAGVSTAGRQFRVTHDHAAVTDALSRIASDLAAQVVTLGNLWNNLGKRAYLNRLEEEGVLPRENHRLREAPEATRAPKVLRQREPVPLPPQNTFIPKDAPHVQWIASQQRARGVWEELQSLSLRNHPNAVSALMRILVELAVESYAMEHGLKEQGNLSKKVGAVGAHLLDRGVIDQKYYEEIERIRLHDQLISISSIQRYIHSPDFAPMESELRVYWTRLGKFLLAALNR